MNENKTVLRIGRSFCILVKFTIIDLRFSSDEEEYLPADVLSFEIITVNFVMDELETAIVLGRSVVRMLFGRYNGFASGFTEEAKGGIVESRKLDGSSVSCIYGRCFTARDYAVSLVCEYTAFSVLTARKTVN